MERRNEIVECLEMDRRREVEEDRSINKHMGLFAGKGEYFYKIYTMRGRERENSFVGIDYCLLARNKNELLNNDNNSSKVMKTVKKGKLKEKLKEKKSKKISKKDADKDVDETEVKPKRHNKRKWF